MLSDWEDPRILYRLGRFEQARSRYLQILESHPKNAVALERLGTISLWKNDTAEAERYFTEAIRHLPFHKRIWPSNAKLKYLLAITYYRQDRCAEAAKFFTQAAGLGPKAMRPFEALHAFAKHMSLFLEEPPFGIEGPPACDIPFLVVDPLPVLPVMINGRGPFNFFVDTGAADVILDADLAKAVGARICGGFRADFAGKKQVQINMGRIENLEIGPFSVRRVPVYSLNVKVMSDIFDGIEVSGVIGTRLLMHFLSTIDYAAGTLRLRIAGGDAAQKALSELFLHAKAIPFWLIETHYIVAWGRVNHLEPQLLFVDTGIGDNGFTAPAPLLDRAGIAVDWSRTRTNITAAGEVRCADFVVDSLALGYGKNEIVEREVHGVALDGFKSIAGEQLGFQIGGLISHSFFRNHALTLDFVGMRLIVE
jgi:hypothetical protein